MHDADDTSCAHALRRSAVCAIRSAANTTCYLKGRAQPAKKLRPHACTNNPFPPTTIPAAPRAGTCTVDPFNGDAGVCIASRCTQTQASQLVCCPPIITTTSGPSSTLCRAGASKPAASLQATNILAASKPAALLQANGQGCCKQTHKPCCKPINKPCCKQTWCLAASSLASIAATTTAPLLANHSSVPTAAASRHQCCHSRHNCCRCCFTRPLTRCMMLLGGHPSGGSGADTAPWPWPVLCCTAAAGRPCQCPQRCQSGPCASHTPWAE